jgi:hypothetical protein
MNFQTVFKEKINIYHRTISMNCNGMSSAPKTKLTIPACLHFNTQLSPRSMATSLQQIYRSY